MARILNWPPQVFFFTIASALLVFAPGVVSQQSKKSGASSVVAPAPPALKRTNSRKEARRFGYAGMVTVNGAPRGAVSVEGWRENRAEIEADTELQANTEEELDRLSAVNGFVLDDDVNHLTLLTTGTHDRKFMKRAAKNFPKHLLSMPWKLDYRLKVPAVTDLEIFNGAGAVKVSGVEGLLRINAGESDATLVLTGGDVEATFQRGRVSIVVTPTSWRGRGASLRLASGEVNVELPAGFSGDVNAEVLRAGRVEVTHNGLVPREGEAQSDRSKRLRGGAGGATLSFTVGDGTLRVTQADGKR